MIYRTIFWFQDFVGFSSHLTNFHKGENLRLVFFNCYCSTIDLINSLLGLFHIFYFFVSFFLFVFILYLLLFHVYVLDMFRVVCWVYCTCSGWFVYLLYMFRDGLCSELYMFKVVCLLYCTVHVQGGLCSVLYMFSVVCVLCTCIL